MDTIIKGKIIVSIIYNNIIYFRNNITYINAVLIGIIFFFNFLKHTYYGKLSRQIKKFVVINVIINLG